MLKQYVEKVDYIFVQINDSDVDGIKLLVDKYNGVIYHYHKVRFKEENNQARMEFGYTIVDSGTYNIDLLNNDEEFHTVMGDILTTILMKQVENEQNRNDNPEKLIVQ